MHDSTLTHVHTLRMFTYYPEVLTCHVFPSRVNFKQPVVSVHKGPITPTPTHVHTHVKLLLSFSKAVMRKQQVGSPFHPPTLSLTHAHQHKHTHTHLDMLSCCVWWQTAVLSGFTRAGQHQSSCYCTVKYSFIQQINPHFSSALLWLWLQWIHFTSVKSSTAETYCNTFRFPLNISLTEKAGSRCWTCCRYRLAF